MNITIRNAEIKDYESIENILIQVHRMHVEWRDDIYRMNDEINSFEHFSEIIADNTYIVAEADGQIVGVLYYFYKTTDIPIMTKRKTIYVDTMAVEENYRGKGIGTAMFDTVREIALKEGCTHIELQVNAKNTAAQQMYKKYGFSHKNYVLDMKLD